MLLPFLLILQVNSALANPLFAGFTADYEVSKNGIVLGVSHRQLIARDQGKKLDYASTTIPTGIIALFVSDRFMEHSTMQVKATEILPQQYEYQRTGGKKETTFQARFDWRKKHIFMSSQTEPQALLPDTQDLLSFQIALMQGLARGLRQFKFQIVDHKRIQLQELDYTQSSVMETSLGRLDVLQLNHHAAQSNYRFTFWCAKQLFFLPIKITKTEQDGDIVQLKLQRFNKKAFYLQDQSNEGDID